MLAYLNGSTVADLPLLGADAAIELKNMFSGKIFEL